MIEQKVDLLDFIFDDLLSSTTYDIKVNYSYDLNDGNGQIVTSNQISVTTLAKTVPIMRFTDAIIFSNTLTAWFRVDDIDQVGSIVRFDLYKDNIFVSSISEGYSINVSQTQPGVRTGSVSFTVSGTGTYDVIIIYTYDLDDGDGIVTVDKDTVGTDNKIRYIQS